LTLIDASAHISVKER